MHTQIQSFCFNRSRNSANSSSPCARARRSSHPQSWRRWTPSGPNGVPNGSGEEKYFTSASPTLGNAHTRRLTSVFCFIFFQFNKVSGRSFLTRCHRLMRSNSQKILGSSTIRPSISSWNVGVCVRQLHMLPSVGDRSSCLVLAMHCLGLCCCCCCCLWLYWS
jgi:hypothetical protein